MFYFGLLSTNTPYVVTILAYLLSMGYFAFAKPQPKIPEDLSATNEIVSGNRTDQPATLTADCYHFYGVAATAPAKELDVPKPVAAATVVLPKASPKCPFSAVSHSYTLFSRPPTKIC